MTKFENLTQVLQSRSKSISKGITFISGNEEESFVTYKNLYDMALKFLGYLQSKGVKHGDEVILQIDDNKDYVFAFWACLLGGVIPVPITVGNNTEHRLKLFRVIKVLNNPYILTTGRLLSNLEKFARQDKLTEDMAAIRSRSLFIDDMGSMLLQGDIHMPEEKDTAFIQFSSGSTGEPKGVVLTHANLMSNIYASIKSSGTGPEDSMITWMPLTHDMGMIGSHMLPLVADINQYIMPTALFIRRPTIWMKKACEHKVNILSSPNFGFKYLLSFYKPDIAKEWDLSHIKIIYNGAEPISTELCHEFLEKMSIHGLKRTSIFPVYGLAEASVAVTFPKPGKELAEVNLDRRHLSPGEKIKEVLRNDNNCVTYANVGYPLDDCRLRICDDENNVLEECTVGHIQIKGGNVTNGYYRNKEATDSAMTKDGWLKTGDLGFLKDRQLVVTGRLKDIIFINGLNYYPFDIERMAEQIEGVENGGVASCGIFDEVHQTEDIVVFVIFKKNLKEFINLSIDIKKLIGRQIGIEVKEVIPVRKLPKTTSGKIQRYILAQRYRDGEFDGIIQELRQLIDISIQGIRVEGPENEIEEKLLKMWSSVLKLDNIGVNDNFFEIGGNSSLMVQMIAEIENEYPDTMKITDPFEKPTVRSLAEYIQATLSNQNKVAGLKSVEYPEYFFNVREMTYGQNVRNAFKFQIRNELLDRVRVIANSEGFQVFDVLFVVYSLLVSKITEKQSITVQTMFDDYDVVNSVTVDFDITADLSEVLGMIKNNRIEKDYMASYRLQDTTNFQIMKDKSSILSLIYLRNKLRPGTTIPEEFDVILEIFEKEDSIDFICDYNSALLRKDAIEQMFNQYVMFVRSLANNY